jgi:hypothetical protein
VTETRRLVVEPGAPGGPPHVRMERIVRWQLVGAAEPEPTAEEARTEFLLGLRDAGIGPEPVLSYSNGDDGEPVTHLDWPDLATHVLDPEYARLLALASLPIFRECPELDGTPPTDRETEVEIERLVHEGRERSKLIKTLVAEIAPELAGKQRRERRARKRARGPEPERQPTKGPPKPSRTIFTCERDEHGWHWTRFVPRPRRTRARIRR